MVDNSKVLPDSREYTIPEGRDSFDVGAIKLVPGQMNPGAADVGIKPHSTDGRAFVDSVRPDSSAAKAGVKPGESLLAVDGRDCTDLGPLAISSWLGGPPGTQVKVTVGARTLTLDRAARAGM
jgi:S1-C subfamily serine protease